MPFMQMQDSTYGSELKPQCCTNTHAVRPQRCTSDMFPMHATRRELCVLRSVSLLFWLRLAQHAFATPSRPHTKARPFVGALKLAHPRGAFCPLHFKAYFCGNGKTNRNPGWREWWFPPEKCRFNNPAQDSTKPYVLSIISQSRGQIYTLTSFCRRINAKPVIKSSRKPGHLAIKM